MSADITIPIGAAIALVTAHAVGIGGLVKWIISRELSHLDARFKVIEQQGAGAQTEIHGIQLDLARNYWRKADLKEFMQRITSLLQGIPCRSANNGEAPCTIIEIE